MRDELIIFSMENTLSNAVLSYLSNNSEAGKVVEAIAVAVKEKPVEAVNEILLICNDYITSKQISFKQRVMELINEIVEMNMAKAQMMLFNYIKKTFKDITCIPLAIKALYKLSIYCNSNKAFLKELVVFVNEMFTCDKLNLPAYSQETRHFGLELLSKLIITYAFNEAESIKMIGVVIDCIEGEKDPRNLLLVFGLVPTVYRTFPYDFIKPFDKSIYDILIDYYPIDFSPPKNSPDAITAKDLSTKLNEALSIECFSSYFFKEINEYDSAPSEVFSTLQAVTSVYSNESIIKYYTPISNFIINALMNYAEEELHIEGLVAFNFFIKRVSMCSGGGFPLRKTFDYLSDQVFSDEDIKRSCDAKDLLCVLIEHSTDSALIQSAFEVIIKALSHFLLTKKHFILLKNVNSLLFFALRKSEGMSVSMQVLANNKKLFLILQELIKEGPVEKEELSIVVIDVLSAIAVKCKGIYTEEEVDRLLAQIKGFYYGTEGISKESLSHLAYCLSEMIRVYPQVDWTEQMIGNSLKKEITKHDVALLKALLMSTNKPKRIFGFLIDAVGNEEVLQSLEEISRDNYQRFQSLFEEYAGKLNAIILTNCFRKEYYPLLNQFVKHKAIIDQQTLLIKLLSQTEEEKSYSSSFIEYYPLIKEIISSDNLNHDSEYDLLLAKYNQLALTETKDTPHLLSKIGKCIYLSLKSCSNGKKSLIYASLPHQLNSFFTETDPSLITVKEPLLSYHLNALIADYKSEQTSSDILKLLNAWLELFTSLPLSSPILTSQCFHSSKLFRIEIPVDLRESIQIKLKSNRSLEHPVLALMLNIYSKASNEEDDILFILHSKALLLDIQVKSSIQQIRRLLVKAKDLKGVKRAWGNVKAIIAKLLLLLEKEPGMKSKVDILKLLGLLRNCIDYDEEYCRGVTIQLRKCLSATKRKVRQLCGVTITIWNMIE